MFQKLYSILLVMLSFMIASNSVWAQAPSKQASYVSFSNVDETQMRISWINGNGGNRIVTITPAGETVENPTNGTNYTANTNYGSAATITTNTRVVYNGSGRTRTVLVSGLTGSTSYTVKVFEYNFSGGQRTYQTADAVNNPRGIKTAIAKPSNITFSNIGFSSASATWTGGTSTDMILSLYNNTLDGYHIFYEESNIGDVSYGDGTSYSFTLQDLDLDLNGDPSSSTFNYGIRLKAKDGAEESAWFPANFTSSTFQTIEDATPPSFTYSIYTENSATTFSSATLTPGTYYVKVVSSELLNTNPEIKFQPDATDNSDGTGFQVLSSTITNTLSDTEWLYTLTIPTANYDVNNSVNSETTTFTITGDDYALNSGTVTNIASGVGFASYYIDNRPPADLSVTVPSGTFGIGETITATITIANSETSATYGSMTFNGVDVASDANFNELGSGSYTIDYNVSEFDTDLSVADAAWTSLSFSMIDEHGNSSTYIATATIGGSNTLTIDAHSPTVTMVYLPTGNFAVDNNSNATITFTALGAGESTTFNTGVFNGQNLSSLAYIGGAYNSGSTSTFTAVYTVVEDDLDIIGGTSSVSFSIALTDHANNTGASYTQADITPNNSASFNVDANSPSITAVYLPSSTFGIGDVVTATITMAETDRNNASYSLNGSATINNVEISSINLVSGATYTASFTVPDGGTDYIWNATEGVSLSFTIDDAFNNTSAKVEAAQASGSITIDATKPVVTAAWIPASDPGEYGIGSTFNIDIVFTETDDAVSGSATFNTANLTANTTVSSDTYTLVYTVGDGHPNIFNATEVPGTFTITDRAGNSSTITNINADVIGGGIISIVGQRPTITDIFVPAGTFTVGDVVSVTFTTNDDNFTDDSHTFTIADEVLVTANFDNIGSNSYTASFTVTDGGTDVDGLSGGSASLTYLLQTSDTFGNASLTYNQTTLAATLTTGDGGNNFIIDANRPEIASATVTNGLHGIGQSINITFAMTDAEDFTGVTLVNNSSSFNSQSYTSFTENLGDDNYTLQYAVLEGHTNVASIDLLSASITVVDKYGNSSLPTNPFWSPDNPDFIVLNSGTFRIDTDRPTITNVFVIGDDYGISETITIVVETNDNNNDLLALNSASFNLTSIPTERWTRNSNSYTTYYVVSEGDNEAFTTATQATTTFSIQDESLNTITTTTYSITQVGGNEVAIDASSPTITALYLPSSTFNVGDNVTVTFTADYSNYSAHTFTFAGNVIGNADFGNLTSNSYSASFTVEENEADVITIDGDGLSFTISTSDTFGNSSIVYGNGAVTSSNTIAPTGSFYLDANSPTITNVVIESGNFKINDEISMTFTFDLNDRDQNTLMSLINGSSSFNGKPLENFTKLSAEAYAATYTVINGDNDVLDIDELGSTSISIQDLVQNNSNVYDHSSTSWTIENDGEFSIIATAPTILAIGVESGIHGAADNISATITTTGSSTLTKGSIVVNDNEVENYGQITGNTSYSFTIPVNLYDTEHSDVSSLSFTMYVRDNNFNYSPTYTQANFSATTTSNFIVDASPATITGVTYAAGNYGIGGVVSATFEMDQNNYNEDHLTINGQTATDYTQIGSSNSYSVTYTVIEGDEDASVVNDIDINAWVKSTTFSQVEMNSLTYSSTASFDYYTSTGAITIDANRPYVDAITFEGGKYGIGTTLTATFTARTQSGTTTPTGGEALEAGLTLTSASINGKNIATSFVDIGSGSYTLAYTISEGDVDRANAGLIPVKIVLTDASGNESNNNNDDPRNVYSTGSTSIDATRPVINDIFVEASDNVSQNNNHKIGDDVTINVVADTDSFGGVAYSSGTISINGEDEAGTLSHNSGTYTFTYTVTEGNIDRTSLASTPMTFTLVDDHGNESQVSTQLNATLSGTNFNIDANRPTFIVDYLFGHSKLTSPLINDYPYIATVNEPFTVRVTTNENVRYSTITPAALQATPTISIVAQGTNNNFTNTNLTYQGTVGGTTTFTIPVRTIAEDLGTDGTVAETVTAVFTDLAGNISTTNPTNEASRSFNIDATKPNFTFTYYTDAGFTTEIPAHGRLDAGTYYIKIEADELVKPLATFTIVNPEDNSFDVSEVFNAGVNTTTFSYEREITDATTVAGLTSETYTITSEDVIGNKLVSGSFTNSDTYLVYVDTQDPTATVTVAFENTNADIITIDNPSATVSVVYNEDMDQTTSPSITFTGNPLMFSDGAGSWSTARTFTQSFTHDLTEEIVSNVSATVNTVSGATDIAGNTDIGAASATFDVNTEIAVASASISLYVFETENVINYDNRDIEVKVWYDRNMNTSTTPSITFTNEANFGSATNANWSGSRTWTATFTHSGTEFEAHESATVSGSDVNGARDFVNNLAGGVESSTFRIDTEVPTFTINAPTSTNNNSATIGNSSVTFTYVVDYDDNIGGGLHAVSLSTNDITVNKVSGNVTSHSISVANNGINSSTISIWAAEGDGYLSLTIGEDVVTDLSGNTNTMTAESATIQIDNTAPTIDAHNFVYEIVNSTRSNTLTIDVSGADYNNAASSSFTFALTDATGGTINSASNGSTSQVNVVFDNLADDGSASITMVTGVFSDIAGNNSPSFTTSGIEVDNTAPTLVAPLTITNIDNTNMWFTSTENLYTDDLGASLTLTTADFAMNVSGGNATLSSFTYSSRNSNTYTFDATWSGEFNGSEAITINALNNTSLFDRAGNALQSSSTVGRNALVRPTITFNAPTPQYVNTAGTATFTIDLTNTATSNLANDDFSLIYSGTGGGTIANYSGGLTTGTFTVTGLTGNGSASITVAADQVLSPEGYGNLSRTTTTPIEVDNINPIATIGQPSLTYTNSAGTFTYLVSYTDENSGLNSVTLSTNDITFDEINGTITSKSFSVTNNGTNSSTVTLWTVEGSGDVAIRVGAGVVTDNANNSNTQTSFSNYVTIDNTPPSATLSYTVNGTERTIGNDDKLVVISATFNEPMDIANNVELDIDVPGAGDIANAVMTRVSATSYTYTWDVDGVGSAGDGAATFTFVSGTDLANNAAADGEEHSIPSFTLDNTPPTISSFSFTNVDNTTAVVIFSEGVYGENAASGNYGSGQVQFANDLDYTSYVNSGSAVFIAVTNPSHSAGSATINNNGIFINNGPSNGSETVVIEAKSGPTAGIYDFAGNLINSAISATATMNKKATIQDAWIVNADATYGIGTSITFNLEFDFVINTASSASMSLNNGGVATYAGGEGSKTISMVYVVSESDNSQVDLSHNATNSISPVNAFTDNRGYEVNQTLPLTTVVTGDHQVNVDTDKPTITIGSPSATIGNSSATFTYVLTYADVTSSIASATTTNADIEFNNPNNVVIGNTLVQTTGTSSSTISLWNITGDGDLSLRIRENVIDDLAGNVNIVTAYSNIVTVDNTPPVVTFENVNPSNVNSAGTATFTFSAIGANLNNLASNSFTLVHDGSANGTINYIGGTTSSATVTVTGLTGNGSASVTMLAGAFTDNATNASIAVTSNGVIVDNTAPVVAFVELTPSEVNSSGTATFVFSATDADLNNLASNSFTLVHDGSANGTINYIGGTTSSATVTVTGLTGNGSASVTMLAGAFTDNATNASIAVTSNGVIVDNTAPIVSSNTTFANPINSSGTATYVFTATEADNNNIVNGTNFTIVHNGTNGGTVTYIGGTTSSATVSLTGVNGDGTVYLAVNSGQFTDNALNGNVSTTSTNAVTIDNALPSATITNSFGTFTPNQNVSATLTFSEAVTGINISDIIQTTNGSTTVSATYSGGTIYELTINATTPNQNVSVWLDANEANDNAGNGNTSSNTLTYLYQALTSYSQVVLTDEGTSSTVSLGSTNRAFTLEINDDKGQGTDGLGDDLNTIFTQVTIGKSGSYNFDDLIESATFYSNNGTSLGTATVNASNLVFNISPSQTITDDNSGTYYVNYKLNSSSTFDIDNVSLTFTLNGSTGITTAVGSTVFDNVTKSTGDFNANQVKVAATKLLFASQPQNHTLGNGATFTVRATDAGNNLDKDFVGEIRIVSTIGKASAQDSTENAGNGTFTFNSYKFNTWASNTTIKAQATGLTEATSNAFSIRANAPTAPSGIAISRINNLLLRVRWTAGKDASGNDAKSLVLLRIISNNNYALLNDDTNDEILSQLSSTFEANSSYLNGSVQSTDLDDINGGKGKIVLYGIGEQFGTEREVEVTSNINIRSKNWSAAIYSFDGATNDINTISFNVNNASKRQYVSKDIFEVETDKVSPNNLFSVGGINPNPVRDEFRMNLTLNETLDVTVDLYSTVGQKIGTLFNASSLSAGTNVLFMNMSMFDVSQGTYMLQIKAGDEIMMVPFVFQK